MPHAALWVVQRRSVASASCSRERFNAARGFVGGAATMIADGTVTVEEFQCRTRLCGWCSLYEQVHPKVHWRFNAARGFVGGAAYEYQTHC